MFRDAQNFKTGTTGPTYSVTFLNPSFETSKVFQEFLELIVDVPIQPRGGRTDAENLEVHVGLFRFLEKWDCSPHSTLLFFNHFHEAADSSHWARLVFAIGACAGNHDLAVAGLSRYGYSKVYHASSVWNPMN